MRPPTNDREIEERRLQEEFIARGLASREESRRTGEYFPAEVVIAELELLLANV